MSPVDRDAPPHSREEPTTDPTSAGPTLVRIETKIEQLLALIRSSRNDAVVIDSLRRDIHNVLRIQEDIQMGLIAYGPRQTSQPPPPREELGSFADLDAEADAFKRTLRERIRDPKDRLTSDRARAIVRETVEMAKVVEDATILRRIRSGMGSIFYELLKSSIIAIVFSVAGFMVHYLMRGGH